MTPALIAVIEDEEHLAQGLLFNLEAEGYRVHHESDGDAALAWLLATEEQPTAILLDVMLPGRDGFSIVRALREAGHYTPVLMLTARGRSEDVVEGFEAGADDYLPKPFDLAILFARLSGLLRRMHWQREQTPAIDTPPPVPAPLPEEEVTNPTGIYLCAGRTINFDDLEIRTPDKVVHLTLMEADLLRYLIERPGKIIARKEILENVWHVHEDTDTRAIDNFIVRLRRYLEPNPSNPVHLLTVRGVGYRFTPEEQGLGIRD
ncbi:response regulator transcription factor [Granulicella mallensis]|uniref:Two component transcriptional regulator, winged helix family n=1 Tax=Granulicella mallensis (strain ATCC BAA-1857 / DSM 23137 / MP5ACTX8) TaxID=682795 RepID=G8NZ01_GRAMM|nr:response regulator transcription factor [Granulicella mallensis]AEU35653.1 two component transcriptional regulator, winged helix family [Granulicella mallensis MP5ACTX8]